MTNPPGLHYNCWQPVLRLEPERRCIMEDRHLDRYCEGCALRGEDPEQQRKVKKTAKKFARKAKR